MKTAVSYEVVAVPPGKKNRRRLTFGLHEHAEAKAAARDARVPLIVHYDDGSTGKRCPWTGIRAGRGWRSSHFTGIR